MNIENLNIKIFPDTANLYLFNIFMAKVKKDYYLQKNLTP